MTVSAATYYSLLRGLRPSGAYRDLDTDVSNCVLRCLALSLYSHRHAVLEDLKPEIFPNTADECLPEWELLLGISPPGGSTKDQRREAILARWRGGVGISASAMRGMLYPLLHPTTAFWDRFNGGELGWRWRTDGAGTISVVAGELVLSVSGGTHCDWSDAEQAAPMVAVRLYEPTDGVDLIATVSAFGGGADTAGGLALYESRDDVWLFGLVQVGASTYPQVDRLEDGELTRNVWRGGAVASYPQSLLLADRGGQIVVGIGATEATIVETSIAPIGTSKHRETALYARNTAPGYAAASITFADCKFKHETPENNVEIVEHWQAAGSAQIADVYRCFIHREPDDAGDYNLVEAQRSVDRAKMGHISFGVGESDEFLCDDDYSLTDRDILGV